jgi:DNA-binding response OmpR family regulator
MLLDYQIPKMIPLQVLKALREKYSASDLPVIMVTVASDIDDMVGP